MRAMALGMLMLAGCGDGGIGIGDDMAVAEDMTVAADLKKPDMAMPPLGCADTLQCLQTTGSGACFMRATAKAQMLLTDMLNCGIRSCIDTDAGTGDCMDEADQSNGCYNCAIGELMAGGCPAETNACLADT